MFGIKIEDKNIYYFCVLSKQNEENFIISNYTILLFCVYGGFVYDSASSMVGL